MVFTKWGRLAKEQNWEVRATVWNYCCTCFCEADLETDHETILWGETLDVSRILNSVGNEDKWRKPWRPAQFQPDFLDVCRLLLQAWIRLVLQIYFQGKYPLLGSYQGNFRKEQLMNCPHWRAGSQMRWGNPLIWVNTSRKPGRGSSFLWIPGHKRLGEGISPHLFLPP